MMTISILILSLILPTGIASEVEDMPAWVDSTAYDYVQAHWRQNADRLTSDELKRDYGLSGNYDTFECEFRYPGYVGSIDFHKYCEGAELIECVEVFEAYAFSVYFGDSYIARLSVARYNHGNYRMLAQSSFGKLRPRSADLFWQLYQHFDTQTRKNLRFIAVPDAEDRVLMVENNTVIGIYSYDHINEVIVEHDTQEYLQQKVEYFTELKNDPAYKQSKAFSDSLFSTPEYQQMPRPAKYLWMDAVQRGIVR